MTKTETKTLLLWELQHEWDVCDNYMVIKVLYTHLNITHCTFKHTLQNNTLNASKIITRTEI